MGGPGRTHVRSGDRQQSGTTPPQPDAPELTHDEGRDSRLAHLMKARMLSAACIGSALMVFGGFSSGHSQFGDARALAAFVVIQAVSLSIALRLQPSDSRLVQQFDEAVFVASVLLLPPAGVVLVLGGGTALGNLLSRAVPRAIAINGGVFTVSALAGVMAVRTVENLSGTGPWSLLASSVAGCVVFAISVDGLLALGLRFVFDDHAWAAFMEQQRARVRRAPFLVLLGFLAGVSAKFS